MPRVDLLGESQWQCLASPPVGDNVIGILGRLTDSHHALQRLVQRIARLKPSRRAMYLDALMVVAGLRGLEPLAEREVKRVPVIIDILENKVLGREYKRGLDEGIEKGRKRGITKGARLARKKAKRSCSADCWNIDSDHSPNGPTAD